MEAPLDPPPGSNNNNTMGNLYETEGGRGCRSKRKQTHPTFCPVCKCTLRPSDVDQHLNCELEKLQKISKSRSSRLSNNGPSVAASSSSTSSSGSSNSTSQGPSTSSASQVGSSLPGIELYRKYQQVRNNRQSRQKAKCKRRKLNDGSSTSANTSGNTPLPGPSSISNMEGARRDQSQCPVCSCTKSKGKILMHVERCLARSERRQNQERTCTNQLLFGEESSMDDSTTDEEIEDEGNHDNDEIDVEGYEEYEWAGQNRVRLTTLVEGKIASLIATASSNVMSDDVDEDLIVDDVDQFGPPQYTEGDMIPCTRDWENGHEDEHLRRAVLSPIMRTATVAAAQAQHLTTATLHHRSRSAEPHRAGGEIERLEKRTKSDPLPVINAEPAQTSSGEAHSYPPQNSTPPPHLVPIDTLVPTQRSLSDSSRSSSPLPPFLTTASFWDLRPSVSMEAMSRGASTSLSGLSTHFMMDSVPRLSAIAQDVADRAHFAGANPPSISAKQAEPINHLVIESLLAKIRELEKKIEGDVHKCLICMDRYRKPVISTTCWHVHCEECWLRTLGAKKLCPQCNTITTPNDLRKIFI